MASKRGGRYVKDEVLVKEASEAERSPQLQALDAGRKKKKRAAAAKRKTEREFLQAIVAEISLADFKAIAENLLTKAKKGDSDALAFLGRYVLGGGKVSLVDVARPSMIRRTRR